MDSARNNTQNNKKAKNDDKEKAEDIDEDQSEKEVIKQEDYFKDEKLTIYEDKRPIKKKVKVEIDELKNLINDAVEVNLSKYQQKKLEQKIKKEMDMKKEIDIYNKGKQAGMLKKKQIEASLIWDMYNKPFKFFVY